MPSRSSLRRARALALPALLGASSALAQNAVYPVTVFAGETYTYHGFGFSQGSGSSQVDDMRPVLMDLTYDAFRAQHFRMFVTMPGRGVFPSNYEDTDLRGMPNPDALTYASAKATFLQRYISNGVAQQALARGATILQLSPSSDESEDSAPRADQPAELQAYAQNIANLIRDLRQEYGLRVAVTGICNEANTQLANGWDPEVVREVSKALRTALDTTALSTGGTLSYVEILPTESASADNIHLGFLEALIEDQDAYDSVFAFGSHAYGYSLSALTESRIWGRHHWMNEASVNGFDSETFDTEAAKVPGRFYNDLNQGASLWTFFIGYGFLPDSDQGTKMVNWDRDARALSIPLKYHYALPMVRAFEPGAVLRRSFSVRDGTGRWTADQQRSAVFTLVGRNPDGAWSLGLVNTTGITNPSNHPAAATYDVPVTIEELVGRPAVTFAVLRSRVENGLPVNAEYAGTITSSGGVVTIPNLRPREGVVLRQVLSAPAPTQLLAHTRNEGGYGETYLHWAPSPRAITYDVERGPTSSGPWTPLAPGVARNHHVDPNPAMGSNPGAAGAPQFYRVRAVNPLGTAISAVLPVNPRFDPVLDNRAPQGVALSGSWNTSSNSQDFAEDFRSAAATTTPGLATATATVTPRIPNGGLANRNIYLWWPTNSPSTRTATARVTVVHAGGTSVVHVNQRTSGAATWNLLPGGPYSFNAGTAGSVTISNADSTDGSVVFDAVRIGEAPSATSVPAAPGALHARAVASRQVALRWTDYADNEESFVVERSTGGGAYAPLVATPAVGPDQNGFADTTALPGTTYSYRVKAVNNGGANSSAYTNVVTVATPPAPAAPTDLVASQDERDIVLAWTDHAVGEFSYLVERKAPADAGWTEIDVIRGEGNPAGAPRTARYRDRFTAENAVYHYRVRAADTSGVMSPYSNSAYTASGIDGTIIDNRLVSEANTANYARSGLWSDNGGTVAGHFGPGFVRSTESTGDTAYIRFLPDLPAPGSYRVSLRWPQGGGYAHDARAQVSVNGALSTTLVNQTTDGGRWYPLGTHAFGVGPTNFVQLRRSVTGGLAGGRHLTAADSARFVRVPLAQATRFAEADAYVANETNVDRNYGADPLLVPEQKGTTIRKTYLRFDVTEAVPVSAATLRLVVASTGTGTHTFTVYGLRDGVAGESPAGWTEGGITWNNAPANALAGTAFTADAELLGSFQITGSDVPGTVINFSNAALRTFLNADTNGRATLMLIRSASTGSSANTRFHSKETTTDFVTNPALLTTGQ